METTVNIVGIGFRPTDEELVDHYLKRRLLLQDNPDVHLIPDIDLCNVEPWHVEEMLEKSVIRFKDPEWFFFSPVGYKYSNSKRFNRTTKCGFWKTTGKDRKIRTWDNTVIGTKKTLVFYEGRVPHGVKSNWVIHEYHSVTFPENQRTFVLCRLMKRPEKTTEGGADALICDGGEPMVSEYENQTTAAGIPCEGTFTEIGTTFQDQNYDAYFRNENNNMQTPLETTIENDEFFHSLLDEIVIDEEPTVIDEERTIIDDEEERTVITVIDEERTVIDDEEERTVITVINEERTVIDDEEERTVITVINEERTIIDDEEERTVITVINDEERTVINEERIVIDDEERKVIDEERTHAFVNSSTQSKSLKRTYCESSDTDAEFVSKLDGDIVDASTMCIKYPSSDEYHTSKWFKSSDIEDTSTMCIEYPSIDEYYTSKWFELRDIVDISTMCIEYPS